MPKYSQPGWPIDRINDTFKFHSPMDVKDEDDRTELIQAYGDIREAGRKFAHVLNRLCPNSAEKVRAINAVQEAVMIANAALALGNGVRPAGEYGKEFAAIYPEQGDFYLAVPKEDNEEEGGARGQA